MSKTRGWSLDSLVLIFCIVVLAQVLTYLVPQGRFERAPYPDNPSKEMVVAGTYAPVPAEEQQVLWPWHFLVAIPKGLGKVQEIVFLVFLVGGVIGLLRASGAIDAVLHAAVARLGSKPWVLIALACVLTALILIVTGAFVAVMTKSAFICSGFVLIAHMSRASHRRGNRTCDGEGNGELR